MRVGGCGERIGGSDGLGQLAVGVEAITHLLNCEEFSTHSFLSGLEFRLGKGAEEQEVDASMECVEPGVVAMLPGNGVEKMRQGIEKKRVTNVNGGCPVVGNCRVDHDCRVFRVGHSWDGRGARGA